MTIHFFVKVGIKFLEFDWLRALQVLVNTVQKQGIKCE